MAWTKGQGWLAAKSLGSFHAQAGRHGFGWIAIDAACRSGDRRSGPIGDFNSEEWTELSRISYAR